MTPQAKQGKQHKICVAPRALEGPQGPFRALMGPYRALVGHISTAQGEAEGEGEALSSEDDYPVRATIQVG